VTVSGCSLEPGPGWCAPAGDAVTAIAATQAASIRCFMLLNVIALTRLTSLRQQLRLRAWPGS